MKASELPIVSLGGQSTPVTRLMINGKSRRHVVELKREDLGPFGSIKGRVAVALVQDAVTRRPDVTHIVESTSGNLGHALARICRMVGLKFTAVLDPHTPPRLVESIERAGGSTVVVHTADNHGNYLGERVRVARAIADAETTCLWTDQYSNPANPRAHMAGLAPEIFKTSAGPVAAVVVAVSTGGTARGIYDYICAHSPHTRLVAVDVVGSRAMGAPAGPRLVTGIGASQQSLFLTEDLRIERDWIGESSAIREMFRLETDTGLSLGVSSGAVLNAASRWLDSHSQTDGRVVCIAADRGGTYAHLRDTTAELVETPQLYQLQEA